jgi:hypothetical protein
MEETQGTVGNNPCLALYTPQPGLASRPLCGLTFSMEIIAIMGAAKTGVMH